MSDAAPRRLVVLRGTREQTRAAAADVLHALDASEVVWACADPPPGAQSVPSRSLDALLGRTLGAVVIDLHDRLDPDAIACAEGLVRAGGALLLRVGVGEIPRRSDMAVVPYRVDDVGTRFAERFARALPAEDHTPLPRPTEMPRASDEQDALVDALAATFESRAPCLTVLVADRGRGKSAALGRALARTPHVRVLVTARDQSAVREVLRFAAPTTPTFVPPVVLARGEAEADVIVVDEAAQLPVATVRAIALRHRDARIALATTTRGYEGTGRGFALRLVPWARARGLPVVERTLRAPIRFGTDDPLERWAFDALLLDAEPASLDAKTPPRAATHVHLDRGELARDERLLRQLFGLLVSAHYRTTPDDLARLLDAPNLDVHALVEGDDVVAASLVAREGSLPAALAEAMARGDERIVGHALADTLVTHAQRPEAGALAMVRSIRIAVHEERRRRGLARQLVDAIHASYAPDLFGTMFGATPELVAFRRALGYEVVRLGVSRGARSGEVSVVMVRPVGASARALVDAMREDLAHELPAQLAAIAADDGAPIEEALASAILAGLPSVGPRDAATSRRIAERYARSAQPVDAVLGSLGAWARDHGHARGHLDPASAALIEARLVDRASWAETARRAGKPSAAAAMRAMRDAVRALLRATSD